jgi:diadenylate cyclase
MPKILESLLEVSRHFRVVDAVDILLVSLLVYQGLLVMRQTRAIPLLKGVGMVLVAVLITTWFPTFNWMVSRLILPGAIALVVIFQPELRMALERLGRGGWISDMLDHVSVDERQWVINEVVDVVEYFAERRIGALMVLQRHSSLMDITRTGKTINARVSSELLATIFEPHSPLHDGAVVIRGDQLVAAACVLPHSESPSISATTGMRHRAALGLSERTDAVCVVVSEETGGISLAVEGSLSPHLAKMQISERLMALFEGEREQSRFFFWRK